MKFNLEDYVQREHNFAIVDEVDSILIDEARTPLIISGASEESTDTYYVVDRVIPRLKAEEHYTIDEKMRTVALTEEGVTRVEQLLGVENLYDPRNILLLHHVNQGLRAHTLFKRDVDYVVKDGEVIIVDEFTGRLMPGRRWSDGLHQAVEAKENVKIESENQTLATITFQNYFRMYKKLSGMTGTADTEVGRVQGNLRARGGRDSDQSADDPHRQSRRRLQNRGREVRRRDRGNPRLQRARAAGAGRHGFDRKVRARRRQAQKDRRQAFRAEREESRARGGNRRAGRALRRRDDLDQHGRPRHRYRARRQSRVHGGGGSRHQGTRRSEFPGGAREVRRAMQGRARKGARGRRPAHPRHRASRVAAHRQPAARPLGTPGRPRFIAILHVARGRPAAHLRRRSAQGPDGQDRDGRRRADRASMDLEGDRKRAEESRVAQLRHPQASARIRRRDEQAARGGLPSPARTAVRRVAEGRRARHVRRADRGNRRGARQ